MKKSVRRPAVFLDRDGVLIREVNYLRRLEQVQLLKGSGAAVAVLRRAGFRVVVITNQSGVARGYLSLATLAKVHLRLKADLRRHGARLDGLYFCPHHPDPGEGQKKCRCRKPGIGMIEDAVRRHAIDLSLSYFIGDTTTDLATARAAGCTGLLVRTGKGGRDGKYRVKPVRTFRDLAAAARWILRRPR